MIITPVYNLFKNRIKDKLFFTLIDELNSNLKDKKNK